MSKVQVCGSAHTLVLRSTMGPWQHVDFACGDDTDAEIVGASLRIADLARLVGSNRLGAPRDRERAVRKSPRLVPPRCLGARPELDQGERAVARGFLLEQRGR